MSLRALDLAGLVCWAVVTLAFITTRSRTSVFNTACAAALAAAFIAYFSDTTARSADAFAVMLGLGLYWAGLLMLKTMFSRSVSLYMLACFSRGEIDPRIDDRIASRIDDAIRYRLVRMDGDRVVLSPVGKLVDAVIGRLYRVAGVK